MSRGTAFYTVIDTIHDKANMQVQKLKKHIFIPYLFNLFGVCLNKVYSLSLPFSFLETKTLSCTHFMMACLRSEM